MLLFRILSSGCSRFCLYCLSFAWVVTMGRGYNLNTVNRRIFTDPNVGNTRASYFGFSTALYVKTDNEGRRQASVLVGAPRGNASAILSVLEPGTVFNCGINDQDDDTCVEWNLDPDGNGPINVGGTDVDQLKDNAWTGATIGVDYSMIKYPKVVVCAPNWQEKTYPTLWPMLGICYWSIGQTGHIFEKPADVKVVPLLQTKETGQCDKRFSRQYPQAGFSMQLYSESNQSRLLLGCPGAEYGKGVPILIEGSDDPIIPTCISKHRVIRKFDHFGYSVTSGIYHDDGRRWHAASAPTPMGLMGKVLIFLYNNNGTLNIGPNHKLLGTQMGEYFGSSLASCDVNNDKKDEIIVGAPFWSNDMDEGRIYVFTSNHKSFTKIQEIDGTKSGGRFGSVVTCLGDLDNDGYKDIAVGAPYEENYGAVYIYNGNKQGLDEKYSQRIFGKDISAGIRGFGAAISEPRDVDGNDYVDIAVGAYNSGHVVLLRSQPVVIIKVHIPKMEKLQNNVTLLTVNVCSTYEGFLIPETLYVQTTLKVDPLRAYFGAKSNANGVYKLTNLVTTNMTECIPYNITFGKYKLGDPIEIGASLALIPSSTEKFCAACPVVNEQKSKLNDSLTLDFAPYCGRDNKCISIIEVEILAVPGDLENGERYTIGSKSNVGLQVQVKNAGQAAYNTKLHFFIPSPIFPDHTLPGCEDFKNDNSWEIICTLGNPLENDHVLKTFYLDMSEVRSDTEYIELFANVSTQSYNAKEAENFCKFTIHFDVDVNMAITGTSLPDVHSLNSKDEAQEQKSMRSEHIYTVQKFGKSPIEESNVTIWVPTHLRKNNIEVVRINESSGIMDGQPINCRISDENQQREIVDEMGILVHPMSPFSDSLIAESSLKTPDNRPTQESNAANNSQLYVPPANRTFYLNCTNPAVKCVQISCKLNKFEVSNTVAKITITLDVQLQNLIPVAMKAKDIIYLVSNASVSGITRSGEIHQRIETKFNSTSIGTTFVGSPTTLPIATWIIVLSILFGVLLLVLLILGLIKLGFFNRQKKEELEALKAESDISPDFVLETCSSREVLDAI